MKLPWAGLPNNSKTIFKQKQFIGVIMSIPVHYGACPVMFGGRVLYTNNMTIGAAITTPHHGPSSNLENAP